MHFKAIATFFENAFKRFETTAEMERAAFEEKHPELMTYLVDFEEAIKMYPEHIRRDRRPRHEIPPSFPALIYFQGYSLKTPTELIAISLSYVMGSGHGPISFWEYRFDVFSDDKTQNQYYSQIASPMIKKMLDELENSNNSRGKRTVEDLSQERLFTAPEYGLSLNH